MSTNATRNIVLQRDSRKPDPTEPWRYVCPDWKCRGSIHGTDRNYFRCSSCNGTFQIHELWDKKKQQQATHLKEDRTQ